jgi:NDP-sugar pyrophosphorylase family protein
MILAGGQGTRLRGALPGLPKVLAPVCGRPFLSHLLDQLEIAGVREVTLCTGYRAEQIYDAFGERYHEMQLRYSRESEPLGTAGALRPALERSDAETFLVLNGDSYVDCDFEAFERWHRQRRACFPGSLLLAWSEETGRFGTVEVGPDDRITAFREKCAGRPAGWINAGVYLLSRSLIESIPPGRTTSIETDMFPRWIERGLGAFTTPSALIDIGTPESFALAEAFMAEAVGEACQVRH